MGPVVMKITEKYGRGIFAARNIKQDEFIEESPVIIIPKVEWQQMSECVLMNYIFRWNEDKALALGYGSLYNHSYTPNVGYFTNIENQSIDFYAMKDICEGEELMVNYNGDPEDQSPLWFDVLE